MLTGVHARDKMRFMINRRRAAVAAVTAALALGAFAAPASAATASAATSYAAVGGLRSQASASRMPATLGQLTTAHAGDAVAALSRADALKNRSVSPGFSACEIDYFGYVGYYICDTGVLFRQDSAGLEEVFVIGTNWQIWHAWPGSNGWQSLGGAAQQEAPGNGVYQWSSDPYAIYTYGTDGQEWCDNWGIPAWGGWHLCQ
jgi:hypothetical protein